MRTKTPELALWVWVSEDSTFGIGRVLFDVHATHSQQRHQRHLRPPIQLQPHNDKRRQNRKREIRNDTESAIKVAQSNNNLDVDARSLLRVVPFLPVEGNGTALENSDEEEDNAYTEGYHHGAVDNPCVHPLHRDS